jgi:hypothetical protein
VVQIHMMEPVAEDVECEAQAQATVDGPLAQSVLGKS